MDKKQNTIEPEETEIGHGQEISQGQESNQDQTKDNQEQSGVDCAKSKKKKSKLNSTEIVCIVLMVIYAVLWLAYYKTPRGCDYPNCPAKGRRSMFYYNYCLCDKHRRFVKIQGRDALNQPSSRPASSQASPAKPEPRRVIVGHYLNNNTENSSSSSSGSPNRNTPTRSTYTYSTTSYDEGYDDVYFGDDYDWDRYLNDDEYASGVDDAMEDIEW